MSKYQKTYLLLLFLIISTVLFLKFSNAADTLRTIYGYAWSDNIGYLSLSGNIEGVPSTPTSLPTSYVPGAPTDVVAIAGDSQATVSFIAPANDGGSPITGYTITSSPDGVTYAGYASPINVGNLTNCTAYTFTVTATNNVGTGPVSSPSSSVTPNTKKLDWYYYQPTGNWWQDGLTYNNASAYCNSKGSGWRLATRDELVAALVANTIYSNGGGNQWAWATKDGGAWSVLPGWYGGYQADGSPASLNNPDAVFCTRVSTLPAECPVICTADSYTYSDWTPTTCPISGQQTRTVISSGCTGGVPPVLLRACTPIYSVFLNEATGKTCSQVCSEKSMTCQSIGTDSEAGNGTYYDDTYTYWLDSKYVCSNPYANPSLACSDSYFSMTGGGPLSCGGHKTKWTNCRCK